MASHRQHHYIGVSLMVSTYVDRFRLNPHPTPFTMPGYAYPKVRRPDHGHKGVMQEPVLPDLRCVASSHYPRTPTTAPSAARRAMTIVCLCASLSSHLTRNCGRFICLPPSLPSFCVHSSPPALSLPWLVTILTGRGCDQLRMLKGLCI